MVVKALTWGTGVDTSRPFTIPAEGAATRKQGIFGKSGTGKSYAAGVMAEEYLKAGIQVVVIDPVGIWWGLGLNADGKRPGFPIAIFGGAHGQVALTPDMGGPIAQYVAASRVPVVIDLSHSTKGQWRKIVADFCETLCRVNRHPVHVIIEEAPEFVPQRLFGDLAVVFGAVDKMIRLGRNFGIGVTLIGQRLQTTNKDTVSQVDVLTLMRLIDPQGKRAAMDWIQKQGEEVFTNEFIEDLPNLPTGTGVVWSPEWLKVKARVRFRQRETYHPNPDDNLSAQMSGVQLAQAVDPIALEREFRKYVQVDETQIATKGKGGKRSDDDRRTIEAQQTQIEQLSAQLEAAQEQIVDEETIAARVRTGIEAGVAEIRAELARYRALVGSIRQQIAALEDKHVTAMLDAPAADEARPVINSSKLSRLLEKLLPKLDKRVDRQIMTAICELYEDFPDGVTNQQLAIEAGYSASGSEYRAARSRLKKRRLLVQSKDRILINGELL